MELSPGSWRHLGARPPHSLEAAPRGARRTGARSYSSSEQGTCGSSAGRWRNAFNTGPSARGYYVHYFFFCEQEVAALLEHKVLRFSPVTHPCSCRQSSNISAALLSVLRNAVKGTAGARIRGIGKKCHRFLFLNAFSFVQS